MSGEIQNFQTFDPFRDSADSNQLSTGTGVIEQQFVHIRVQKRNGRKCVTIVEGLPRNFKFKKFISAVKHKFCCNGTIVEDEKAGKVIQVSGDQRDNISEFLLEEEIVTKENLKIHGF
ncbi:hypothetical protein FDP41_004211 [Naegleria fowleri]|uniref:SUI1 domain-containing protein n=1 Tax=Naegleria fowleri TaxID=5763 RepID=A0A6A5BPH8_NAEFO|nr:uncharacterized protein FDP41_004211 [Naegleria fowleri]KAF0976916.1 hypothetical protein FDP41_004211 [Naegleria fowleri]CAG4718073.1 unnamed protein product [Naegleria fowleri]